MNGPTLTERDRMDIIAALAQVYPTAMADRLIAALDETICDAERAVNIVPAPAPVDVGTLDEPDQRMPTRQIVEYATSDGWVHREAVRDAESPPPPE